MKRALKTLWSGTIDERRQVHLMLAEAMDAWRVVPRMLVACYGYLVWDVVQWFMALEDPTTQHATLVSTVIGVAGAVIGIYTSTGRKWSENTFKHWNKDSNNDETQEQAETKQLNG